MENIIPNLWEFIPMFVAFVVLFVVLSKFAWPMIAGVLDKRQVTIAEALEQAEAAKIEGERLLEEHRARIADARADVAKIMEEGQIAAEKVREETIAKAKEEAADIVARAHDKVEVERRAAMAELQSNVADISVAIAGKIIGEQFTVEADDALIDKFLVEVGGLNEN